MKYYIIEIIDTNTNLIKQKYMIERKNYFEAIQHINRMKQYVPEYIDFEIN